MIGKDSAVAAWALLGGLIFAYVLAYDIWAIKTGHRTMTNQFRVWLHDPIGGPLIAAIWVGLFVGLTFHFLVSH